VRGGLGKKGGARGCCNLANWGGRKGLLTDEKERAETGSELKKSGHTGGDHQK